MNIICRYWFQQGSCVWRQYARNQLKNHKNLYFPSSLPTIFVIQENLGSLIKRHQGDKGRSCMLQWHQILTSHLALSCYWGSLCYQVPSKHGGHCHCQVLAPQPALHFKGTPTTSHHLFGNQNKPHWFGHTSVIWLRLLKCFVFLLDIHVVQAY